MITGNYEDIIEDFSNEDLYNFTLQSQNRNNDISNFIFTYFGKDYYTDEVNKEIEALTINIDINALDSEFIGTFQGKQAAVRWNLLTAVFDYVKQFLGDEGIDSAFFYKLYKTSLKKYHLTPLKML